MAQSEDCLFCRVVAGEVPVPVVAESENSLAFRDINPQAPTHVLVIPRRHCPRPVELATIAPDEAADLLRLAADVAAQEGVEEEGYRLVFNTGTHGQQTVDHVHMHVIGGRQLTWPPG